MKKHIRQVLTISASIVSLSLVLFLLISSLGSPLSTIGQAVTTIMETPSFPQAPLLSEGTTYVYGTHLIASKTQASIQYHLPDMIGSNRYSTDNLGRINSRFTSYPYGRKLDQASFSDSEQKYTYTGKEDDGNLMYYGARYYSPQLGRFISIDPLLTTPSPYSYAGNHPLTTIDPTGKEGEGVAEYLTDLEFGYSSERRPTFMRWEGLGTFPHGQDNYPGGLEWFLTPPPAVVEDHPTYYNDQSYNLYEEVEGEFRLYMEELPTEQGHMLADSEGHLRGHYSQSITSTGASLDPLPTPPNGMHWEDVGVFHFIAPSRNSWFHIAIITTPATDGTEPPPGGTEQGKLMRSLKVSGPNPARDTINIKYTIGKGYIPMPMNIYDVQGRQVESIPVDATPGEHMQRVDLTDKAAGVYYVGWDGLPGQKFIHIK